MTVPTLLLAAALALSAAAPDEQVVHWRGRTFDVARLPSKIPAPARDAVATWGPWAREHGYRLDLTRDGVVLLIAPAGASGGEDRLEDVEEVLRLVDDQLPTPDRSAEPEPLAGREGEGELPEEVPDDPEGPLPEDPGVDPVPTSVAEPAPGSAGPESVELDTATAVLFVVRDEPEYGLLVDQLAERWPYLSSWAEDTRQYPGFVLGHPLAGAFVLQASGQEEFDPRNELINRAARVLLLRRFGEMPNWLVHGWAWHVEIALRDSVYVFPYRDEFVFVTEHTDWDKDLRNRFRGRTNPLRPDEFAGWRRGSYSDSHARVAWGVVEFLARHHPEALPAFVERMRVVRDRESRVDQGDGTWKRDRDYEVPAQVQAAALEELVGPEVFAELVTFFVEGDDYRPPRSKGRR